MEDARKIPRWAIVLAVVVAAWGLLYLFGPKEADGEDPGAPVDRGISKGEAWDACKNAVEARLNNPSTADFKLTSVHTETTVSGFDIAGSLTADNSFGVEQVLAFSCEVSIDGADVTAEVVEA